MAAITIRRIAGEFAYAKTDHSCFLGVKQNRGVLSFLVRLVAQGLALTQATSTPSIVLSLHDGYRKRFYMTADSL